MALIPFFLGLAFFGLFIYLLVTYVPMPDPMKIAIVALAVLLLIAWALQQLGIVGPVLRLR